MARRTAGRSGGAGCGRRGGGGGGDGLGGFRADGGRLGFGHGSWRVRVMARVAEHLSIAELEERFRTAKDPILARHVQVIWLLAQGHTSAEVSTVTSFVPRWIEPLRARYNAEGFAALGDLRRHNGRAPSLLKPDLLERLRVRLADPPPDGGLWTSGKVTCWMAGELGLSSVCVQRGWEALRAIEWSIQKPRPRHPKAATPEEESTFKKTRRSRCRRGRAPSRPPGRGVCDRRASPRPEAGPAPRLGAQGRAPDRARPPPLQVALRHGLHPTPLGRDDLVSLHRRLQGVLRRAPCGLRRGKRGRPRAQHRARAGPSRLARRTEPSRSRRDQAVPSAELHTRASAGGASLARARRACREHLLCDTCRSRGRHRPALHRTRQPRPAHRHKLPLVAQTRPTEVISRKPYDLILALFVAPCAPALLERCAPYVLDGCAADRAPHIKRLQSPARRLARHRHDLKSG